MHEGLTGLIARVMIRLVKKKEGEAIVMVVKNINVKLYPNSHMRQYFEMMFGYRRYCWNQALNIWNEMYEMHTIDPDDNSSPTRFGVSNCLFANKQDWEYQLSSRTIGLTVKDLSDSFKRFFNKSIPDAKHPKFQTKHNPKQSFKTDTARIVNGKLRLDKAYGYNKDLFYDIRMSEQFKELPGKLVLVTVKKVGKNYYATLCFKDCEVPEVAQTGKKTAVDVNVGHLNYTDGVVKTLTPELQKLYRKSKHYQRLLSTKQVTNPKIFRSSNNYQQVKTKLAENHRKIVKIQNDMLHKFTTQLVQNYDKIVIEDLDVQKMMITHVASKGMQRSAFARFREYLTYKCAWYGKELILADPSYPSTQLCSECGHRKTGDEKITLQGNAKHHTKHNEYICYECGFKGDRDHNAVMNLLKLAD